FSVSSDQRSSRSCRGRCSQSRAPVPEPEQSRVLPACLECPQPRRENPCRTRPHAWSAKGTLAALRRPPPGSPILPRRSPEFSQTLYSPTQQPRRRPREFFRCKKTCMRQKPLVKQNQQSPLFSSDFPFLVLKV